MIIKEQEEVMSEIFYRLKIVETRLNYPLFSNLDTVAVLKSVSESIIGVEKLLEETKKEIVFPKKEH